MLRLIGLYGLAMAKEVRIFFSQKYRLNAKKFTSVKIIMARSLHRERKSVENFWIESASMPPAYEFSQIFILTRRPCRGNWVRLSSALEFSTPGSFYFLDPLQVHDILKIAHKYYSHSLRQANGRERAAPPSESYLWRWRPVRYMRQNK